MKNELSLLIEQSFPNSNQDMQDQLNVVVKYLLNFFSDSTQDQILRLLHNTNEYIINALYILVEMYFSSKPAIANAAEKIQFVEQKLSELSKLVSEKDSEIKLLQEVIHQKNILVSKIGQHQTDHESFIQPLEFYSPEEKLQYAEILKSLISASYNPRVYLMLREIYNYWQKHGKKVKRNELQKSIGQDRVIASFKEAFELGENATKTASLIHQLVHQEKMGSKIWVYPTQLGLRVMTFNDIYYSRESISNRLMYAIEYNKLKQTRVLLLRSILDAVTPYSNSIVDRRRLSQICSINLDNISKYLTEFVKMGVVKRVPNDFGKNSYNFILFDTELVGIMLDPLIKSI
ncbi:MAG: hypothetical protein ACXAD7_07445 [Candidatus Kariarchaeaceae archaeon]|jgi:hypothetical protein